MVGLKGGAKDLTSPEEREVGRGGREGWESEKKKRKSRNGFIGRPLPKGKWGPKSSDPQLGGGGGVVERGSRMNRTWKEVTPGLDGNAIKKAESEKN